MSSRRAASLGVNARALGLLAGAQLAIGAAAIFARFALTAAGPLSVVGAAHGNRALCRSSRWPLCAAVTRSTRSADRAAFARSPGFALAVHFGTWIASLQHASVAVSTLLVCSTPVFTEAWRSCGRAGRGR